MIINKPRETSGRILFIVFLLLVVAKALGYWVGSWIRFPDDLLSTFAMYRGKDMQSFPIMANLANLGFGEPSLYELHNQGILSERYIPWVFHAFLFKLLGPAGFIVADLVLTPLRFLLLLQFLKYCGVHRTTAIVVSAVLTSAVIGDFGEFTHLIPGFPIRFWGLRIPRPYISELFMLGALIATVRALLDIGLQDARFRWGPAAVLGICAGLLLQTDFYSGSSLLLGTGGLFVFCLWRANANQRVILYRGAVVSATSVAIVMLPMIVQSFYINPDGPVRLGLFDMSRTHPLFITDRIWYVAVAVMVCLQWWLMKQTRFALRDDKQRTGRLVLIAICIGALFSMPVTGIVLGKGIEIYHYRDVFTRFFSLTLLVFALQFSQEVWGYLGGATKRWSRQGLTILAAGICVLYILRFSWEVPQRNNHLRPEFPEWGQLENYRTSFAALTHELSRKAYDRRLVLATFDTQVWSWWVTFRGGYSFLADACTSNVPDRELERRLVIFAKRVGMTREDFLSFIQRRYVNIFWLACSKYQASKAYTFSAIDDYSDEVQTQIARSSIFSNFSVAIPLSEQERLGDVFVNFDESTVTDRLDIMVLTKDESLAGFSPSTSDFELLYENEGFTVWGLKQDQSPVSDK